MDLSIIIVNWKVKDLLRKCLSSVYRETKDLTFEVFVADNDSRDGSVEMVRAEFPQAQLIANDRNLGFAAANNPAIAKSKGEFVLLLNPDAEVVDGALQQMVAFMRQNQHVGILGPKLLGADGQIQPSVRRDPTILSQTMIMFKLMPFFSGLGPLRRYLAKDFDYARPVQVEQIMGAAYLIRRSVITAIGGLDERFFIWFEEVDLCKRARQAGFQVWYTPEATIRHMKGESFGQVFDPKKQGYYDRSLRLYFLKHSGVIAYLFFLALHPIAIALAWIGLPIKKLIKYKPA